MDTPKWSEMRLGTQASQALCTPCFSSVPAATLRFAGPSECERLLPSLAQYPRTLPFGVAAKYLFGNQEKGPWKVVTQKRIVDASRLSGQDWSRFRPFQITPVHIHLMMYLYIYWHVWFVYCMNGDMITLECSTICTCTCPTSMQIWYLGSGGAWDAVVFVQGVVCGFLDAALVPGRGGEVVGGLIGLGGSWGDGDGDGDGDDDDDDDDDDNLQVAWFWTMILQWFDVIWLMLTKDGYRPSRFFHIESPTNSIIQGMIRPSWQERKSHVLKTHPTSLSQTQGSDWWIFAKVSKVV